MTETRYLLSFRHLALVATCLLLATPLAASTSMQAAEASLSVSTALPGLVNSWAADGNADDGAGGNSGQLMNGAGFGPGVLGSAFALDGVDDYVRVPDSPSLDLASGVSIASGRTAR